MTKEKDYITLKWGTIKAWKVTNPETQDLMQKYFDLGASMSAMLQKDTDEQKELLCKIVESVGEPVYLDWDGEYVSVEKAKEYIRNYGN